MSTVFLFKLTLVLLLLFIIFNLAKALIEMVREDPDNPDKPTKPMSHYLGRRVMFSALVVILILIALSSGCLRPIHVLTDSVTTTHKQKQTGIAIPHQQNASTNCLLEMRND